MFINNYIIYVQLKAPKLDGSVLKKEDMPDQWKVFIIAPIHKDNKSDCSNYCVISLLSASYKVYPVSSQG
jgi:hypothetical protein